MTSLSAPRPFFVDARCQMCGARQRPMPAAQIARLYHQIAPFLRLVDDGPGFYQRTYDRRHSAEPPYTPRSATACAVWPLHAETTAGTVTWTDLDGPRIEPPAVVYLEWRGREAPGRRPTFHQFCRAYGLRATTEAPA